MSQYALKTSNLPRKDIALLVAGAGTGGTVTGLATAIRDNQKGERRTKVVAVDPEGSILGGGEPGNYQVEGIGYVGVIVTCRVNPSYTCVGLLSRGVGQETRDGGSLDKDQ